MEILWFWKKGRKIHHCETCHRLIPKWEWRLVRTEFVEFVNQYFGHYVCEKCSTWAVQKYQQQPRPIEAQQSLRF